jgi:hypothetical protein
MEEVIKKLLGDKKINWLKNYFSMSPPQIPLTIAFMIS